MNALEDTGIHVSTFEEEIGCVASKQTQANASKQMQTEMPQCMSAGAQVRPLGGTQMVICLLYRARPTMKPLTMGVEDASDTTVHCSH